MKLKYYLRGAGAGIIVTTLIFIAALAVTDRGPSREEIIAEAEKLGMIMPDDEAKTDKGSGDDEGAAGSEDGDKEAGNLAGGQGQESGTEWVSFSISPGEHSASVIQRLYDMGLIDNIETYNDYMEAHDYDSFLQPGDFIVPKGCNYDELTWILMTKQEDRSGE